MKTDHWNSSREVAVMGFDLAHRIGAAMKKTATGCEKESVGDCEEAGRIRTEDQDHYCAGQRNWLRRRAYENIEGVK